MMANVMLQVLIRRIDADHEHDLAEEEARHANAQRAIHDKRQQALSHAEWLVQNYPDLNLGPAISPAAVPTTSGGETATPTRTGDDASPSASVIRMMKEFALSAGVFTAEDVVGALFTKTGRRPLLSSIRSHLSRLAAPNCGELNVVVKGNRTRRQQFSKTAKFDVNTGVPRTGTSGSSRRTASHVASAKQSKNTKGGPMAAVRVAIRRLDKDFTAERLAIFINQSPGGEKVTRTQVHNALNKLVGRKEIEKLPPSGDSAHTSYRAVNLQAGSQAAGAAA